jgi:hypothetical protein
MNVYVDGVLRERWDDTARVYTAWDAQGVQTTSRPYTAAENAAADAAIARAAVVTGLEERVTALEKYVFGATPPPTTPPAVTVWPVPPNGLIKVGADTWKNVSGAWLTVGPDVYPLGWAKQGVQAAAWVAGKAYKTGDQVTYAGKTYMCLQAHTSQAGWEPGAAPSLWQLI